MDRPTAEEILQSKGFYAWGFLGREAARAILGEDDARWGQAGSVIAVALRYGEGEYSLPDWARGGGGSETAGGEALSIGRFARANWYAELLDRLAAAAGELHGLARASGLASPGPKAWRRFSNSRLPEKRLALAAGLGRLGRNDILIAEPRHVRPGQPASSSAVILGFLLCPVEIQTGENLPGGQFAARLPAEQKFPCGECRRCIQACPTGALGSRGERFSRASCLQNWAGRDEKAPPEVEARMRGMLYGCDLCLKACPHFRTDESAATEHGRIGPFLPASFFRDRSEADIRMALWGTALGLGWISIRSLKERAAPTGLSEGSI